LSKRSSFARLEEDRAAGGIILWLPAFKQEERKSFNKAAPCAAGGGDAWVEGAGAHLRGGIVRVLTR
jgi:hypothetical protein